MPFYELMLVLRPMPKKEVVDCLKRTANHIWGADGVIKKIEYYGHNKLPYSAKGLDEGKRINEGSYFMYSVSLKTSEMIGIRPELKLDMDILKSKFNLAGDKSIPEDYECTLEEELLPPVLRKSVRPLLEDKNVRADVRR